VTRFRPADDDALADAVRFLVAAEEPAELVAGGSKRALGRPQQAPHTLDLGAFRGIRSYEPAELVLTAGAATPLAEIEAALGEARQMLAFEPPDWRALLRAGGEPTLGGVLAANLAGPRRISHGAARDHLLGFSGVSGRGERFKAGGRVVKNVTGYDLSKLMCGSFGTLAALTEVSVKVLPRAEATRTVALRGLGDAAAVKAMCAALGSPHEVSGAAHLPRDGLTLLRVEGPEPSVAARAAALVDELRGEILDERESLALWLSLREGTALEAVLEDVVWRVSIPPAAAPGLLEQLRRRHLDFRHLVDWGGGLVWLAVAGGADGGAAMIRAALTAAGGGHATLIRAPDGLRAAVPVFEPPPPPLAALTARVKESFDPRRILNRGRMYPEL
jgi:glycolate oxidase FAD binding subunit